LCCRLPVPITRVAAPRLNFTVNFCRFVVIIHLILIILALSDLLRLVGIDGMPLELMPALLATDFIVRFVFDITKADCARIKAVFARVFGFRGDDRPF
jgi:hypothetical protein